MSGPLFRPLLHTENIVSPSALDAVEYLSAMEELNTESTLEELSKVIDNLASGKAPGSEGITSPPHPNQALQDCITAFSACTLLSVLTRRRCTTRHQLTPRSSHSSRTRERGATAITTMASHFSASLAKSLQRSS